MINELIKDVIQICGQKYQFRKHLLKMMNYPLTIMKTLMMINYNLIYQI